jgi:putative transposase
LGELPEPTTINQQRSTDFVADQLINGRRFRMLNVTDNFNRELVGQLVAFSISGERVARLTSQIGETRLLPERIVVDNGTEFTSKAMFEWTEDNGTKLQFIQPGKPTQNAFVESINGKFRDECLNQHGFRSMDEAKQIISDWRDHYNSIRPHSSLGYLPPLAFAQQAA